VIGLKPQVLLPDYEPDRRDYRTSARVNQPRWPDRAVRVRSAYPLPQQIGSPLHP
jgi:hypothetical protein